jgi:hypothetical protein
MPAEGAVHGRPPTIGSGRHRSPPVATSGVGPADRSQLRHPACNLDVAAVPGKDTSPCRAAHPGTTTATGRSVSQPAAGTRICWPAVSELPTIPFRSASRSTVSRTSSPGAVSADAMDHSVSPEPTV